MSDSYEYYTESLVFHKDDDLQVILEETDGLLFIHVEVYNFRPSVYKRMKALWKDIYDRAWFGGYESIFCATPKKHFLDRFMSKAGIYHGEVNRHGCTYYIYEWVLEQPDWID